ncbi:uncharacterized protein THITE_2050978, partial [Thermothielavioides terrestris NRRL 8126]
TARDYAIRVRSHAATTASHSLYSGDSFRNLADFLWQPYIQRAPQLPLTHSRPSSRFAVLYHVSSQKVVNIPFGTVREFEALGDSALPGAGSFALLLLQGYPSPEWLNTLGARFGIDPEFFQRHLLFSSASVKGSVGGCIRKRTATHILPSCHGDMVSLQITKIASRQSVSPRHTDLDQEGLDQLRRQTSEEMTAYMSKLASLNSPGVAAADSIIREFSVHGLDYFSLEQTISIGFHACGQGWLGIIWHDAGSPLDQGLRGPWQTRAIRSNSFDVTYLPTPVHTPGVALRSKRRKAGTRAHADNDSPHGGLHAGTSNRAPPGNETTMERILDDYAHLVDLDRAVNDPFYALSPLFSFAVFSEMEILDLIAAKVRDELDHSRLTGDGAATTSPTLSNLLYNQQILQRHIRNLQSPISYMEALCSSDGNTSASHAAPRSVKSDTVKAMLADYRFALAYAEALAADCVQGMSIMAHHAAIRESQKAIAEARGVTRLTRLATLFVPLGLVTSVFSMNVREINAGDGPPLWVWAVVSLVVGAMSWVWVSHDSSAAVRRWWWRWRNSPGDGLRGRLAMTGQSL